MMLRDARARYHMPQKLLFALLVASRKLHQYFQGHPIKILSTYPLERVLRSPNAAGRVAEWNIELHAFQLEFSTTRVIKGAALADFVAEWTVAPEPVVGESQGAGAGAVLISPTQDKLYYTVQLYFQRGEKVSNNIASYEGLITGLKAAAALGVKRLTIKGDSQLLVNFSNKVYEPRDGHMEVYLAEVRKMEKNSWAWNCSMYCATPTRRSMRLPRGRQGASPKNPASSRSESSSLWRPPRPRIPRHLERNSAGHRPREPLLAVPPQEHVCS
ncbi:unnamed protein product [Triticum aestivum]|uniref:Uncharacterized protein n=1 Tax=Triticum aestivum TaxID=4565 RepID=A0A7H4LI13_WHEAT|nr:unnamed protein product [Triticum aestivum]